MRNVSDINPEWNDLPIGEILQKEEYHEYVKRFPKYKINMQQIMKEVPVLDILSAGDGWFVEMDISSLEPTVIAEMSDDPTYFEIYASGKPHDNYLYTAIRIMPWVSDKIDAVYHIDNPTKESVAAAKKQFKSERSTAKVLVLSGTYKAGANKQYNTLKLQGIKIPFDTVKEMNHRFWKEMFAGVTEWEKTLLRELEHNEVEGIGPFILNGMGRPFVILKHKQKDILNTTAQSTGHGILDIDNYHFSCIVEERKEALSGCRCVIEDWHDERVWWAPTMEKALLLKQAMEDALVRTNEKINPNILFKGGVEICKTFTEFKGPDPWTLCELLPEPKKSPPKKKKVEKENKEEGKEDDDSRNQS